jgi:hypothetical protein
MIYAHLGIASDSISGNLGFKVDYTKSCPELFLRITQYFLEKHKDYRILSHVEDVDPLRRRADLPSWVPDWASNKVHDLQENPPRDHQGSAEFSFMMSAEGKHQLACKGLVLGEIRTIGTNVLGFTHLKSAEIRKSWTILLADSGYQPKISPHEESYKESYKRRSKCFEVLVDEVAKVAGLQGSLAFRTSLTRCENNWNDELQSILYSAKEEGPHAEIKLHPTALVSAVPFHFFPSIWIGRYRHRSHQGDLRVLEGRRLCLYADSNAGQGGHGRQITDNIALVPESTQTGDFICSFDGESRMFVLRPITGHEISKKEGTTQCFALVGMCYCSRSYYSSSVRETFILQ